MKVFMTNGTLKFLEKLADKHPETTFFFMNDNRSTLAYYEGYNKDVFAAGREYEALLMSGDILESGFVVMNNIPIPDESQPIFETRFKQSIEVLNVVQGFQAFRLLKPKKGNMYTVFTQWESAQAYESWKNSDAFKMAHNEESIKQPAYFGNRSFVTTYSMVTEKEE